MGKRLKNWYDTETFWIKGSEIKISPVLFSGKALLLFQQERGIDVLKIKIITLALTSLLLMPSAFAADQVFGDRPNLKGTIPVSTLLDAPQKYLGKTVKIQGIATDVCPMRGCWMKIQSDRKKESLLIKVNDGEMVFPLSAQGKHTVIQGKLVKKMIPIKEVIEIEAARAKKAGKAFDPKSIKSPRTVYMFQPTGVVIESK